MRFSMSYRSADRHARKVSVALLLERLDQVADGPADGVLGGEPLGPDQGVQVGQEGRVLEQIRRGRRRWTRTWPRGGR